VGGCGVFVGLADITFLSFFTRRQDHRPTYRENATQVFVVTKVFHICCEFFSSIKKCTPTKLF